MNAFNAYETEKADEKIANSEIQFLKSVLFHLPSIIVWTMIERIKKWIG